MGGKTGSAGAGNALAGEGNGSGGGSSAPDSIFQIPNFEPAVDKPAGTASLGQPGLSSGRGSQGGSAAGIQAPAFGLGQSVDGSKAPGEICRRQDPSESPPGQAGRNRVVRAVPASSPQPSVEARRPAATRARRFDFRRRLKCSSGGRQAGCRRGSRHEQNRQRRQRCRPRPGPGLRLG